MSQRGWRRTGARKPLSWCSPSSNSTRTEGEGSRLLESSVCPSSVQRIAKLTRFCEVISPFATLALLICVKRSQSSCLSVSVVEHLALYIPRSFFVEEKYFSPLPKKMAWVQGLRTPCIEWIWPLEMCCVVLLFYFWVSKIYTHMQGVQCPCGDTYRSLSPWPSCDNRRGGCGGGEICGYATLCSRTTGRYYYVSYGMV